MKITSPAITLQVKEDDEVSEPYRYRAAVAPPPGRREMDLSAPDGPAAGRRRDRRADRAARHREPQLGIPADPGRTAQARSPGERVHDPPGPQNSADPAGAEAAHSYFLAAVPARASCDNARHRFLSCGLRGDPPALVLLVPPGGRQPLRAHPPGRPRTRTGRGSRSRSAIC